MPNEDKPTYARQVLVSVYRGQWRVRFLQGTEQDLFGVQQLRDLTYGLESSYQLVARDMHDWIAKGQLP
jgi:hypothetical protein